MRPSGLRHTPFDWEAAFQRMKRSHPSVFVGLEATDISLPGRSETVCITYDERGRYWFSEPHVQKGRSHNSHSHEVLIPFFGPFDGFNPGDQRSVYERVMSETLSKNKTRSLVA